MKIQSIDTLKMDRNIKLRNLNLSFFWFDEKALIRTFAILLILISIFLNIAVSISS